MSLPAWTKVIDQATTTYSQMEPSYRELFDESQSSIGENIRWMAGRKLFATYVLMAGVLQVHCRLGSAVYEAGKRNVADLGYLELEPFAFLLMEPTAIHGSAPHSWNIQRAIVRFETSVLSFGIAGDPGLRDKTNEERSKWLDEFLRANQLQDYKEQVHSPQSWRRWVQRRRVAQFNFAISGGFDLERIGATIPPPVVYHWMGINHALGRLKNSGELPSKYL